MKSISIQYSLYNVHFNFGNLWCAGPCKEQRKVIYESHIRKKYVLTYFLYTITSTDNFVHLHQVSIHFFFRNGLSRHGFDHGPRSQAALSAPFIIICWKSRWPAWNRDQLAKSLDHPAWNGDQSAWNQISISWNEGLLFVLWPFVYLGRIIIQS